MNISVAEENYIKSIYKLEEGQEAVTTTGLAYELDTKPASVTDMAKKLKEKKLIYYEKYQGINLTPEGKKAAVHRMSSAAGKVVTEPPACFSLIRIS